MAKSKAKRLREKLIREGYRNPEVSRSPFVFADMHTRKTKTKKDVLYRCKHKNHSSADGKNGSYYFVIFLVYIIILSTALILDTFFTRSLFRS